MRERWTEKKGFAQNGMSKKDSERVPLCIRMYNEAQF